MTNLATNRRAKYDYNILEKFEAGLILAGYEVKAVKNGHISLKGAYVTVKDEEAWLINSLVSPYQPKICHKIMTQLALENFFCIKMKSQV